MKKIEIEIYNTPYVDELNCFKMDEALAFCGKVAGVCYSKDGFAALCKEDKEKTDKRIDLTLNSGHHSVYDHVTISLNFKHLPKIVAMLLNNESQYTTSEKSARYTPLNIEDTSGISHTQVELYNKWNEILKQVIEEEYQDTFKNFKIKKLAMENARYFISVFCETEMMYTTSLRQLNYLASWMIEFCNNEYKDNLRSQIKPYLSQLVELLQSKNLLVDGLLHNEKQRSFSLIDDDLLNKENSFSNMYTVIYEGSFAQFAQSHRHRTLHYSLSVNEEKKFYTPPILESHPELVKEWQADMLLVKDEFPQGELVNICEEGRYRDFILKCKERLCSDAQLEVAQTTKQILTMYTEALKETESHLYDDILRYQKGARCTFPDFTCKSLCHFSEGINLTRKI